MQKILSFNTIFAGVNIILQNDGKIEVSKNFQSKKQSEILVSSIEKVLKENNLSYKDIDVFSSITGPGNFTGIKTSLAVLKALEISTNKKIITTNVFEVISHGFEKYDYIILDMGTVKYYIEDVNKNYFVIYKKDIQNFMEEHKSYSFLTNDNNIKAKNIIFSEFSNEKWADVVKYKMDNSIFTDEITPLYIEEALITKRKN